MVNKIVEGCEAKMTNKKVITILSALKKCYLGEVIDALDFAIEAVKVRESRAMTREELLTLPKDTPVFIEENNGECGWNIFYGIDEENDVCFCGFKASADYYDIESYGQEYICWTARPTKEQREKVKWDA